MHVQYPMGGVVSSSCFCNNTHPSCSSHTSVSSFMCPVELDKDSTGGDTRSSSKAFVAAGSFSSSDPIFAGWPF